MKMMRWFALFFALMPCGALAQSPTIVAPWGANPATNANNPYTVTTSTGTFALPAFSASPAPPSVNVCNTGSNPAYVVMGAGPATAGNSLVAAGICKLMSLNSNTSFSAITTGGNTTLNVETGVGSPQSSLPGGAGGGAGFPITLGSTSIAAGSTTTSVGGLALINISAPAANATALAIAGASHTGSDATSDFRLATTLNTNGSPDVFKIAATITAAGASTKLLNLYGGTSGTTSVASIDSSGNVAGASIMVGTDAGKGIVSYTTNTLNFNTIGTTNWTLGFNTFSYATWNSGSPITIGAAGGGPNLNRASDPWVVKVGPGAGSGAQAYIAFQTDNSGTSGTTVHPLTETLRTYQNATNVPMLSLGGVSVSFPALKQNGAVMAVRLADDSADAGISASTAVFSSQITAQSMTQTSTAQSGTVCQNTAGTLTYDGTLGCLTSTETLKEISGTIPHPLATILALRPIAYAWKPGAPRYRDDPGNHWGLGAYATAYEGEELIARDGDGNPRGWRTDAMIATAVGAIQELDARMAKLESSRP